MSRIRTFAFASAIALFASFGAFQAHAGYLATDGSSYLGVWHGTTPYVAPVDSGGFQLKGTADWAVYAPGTFPFGGYTPNPTEYVYVYQLFESGNASLSSFSVLLDPASGANNISAFESGPIVSSDGPSAVGFFVGSTLAKWIMSVSGTTGVSEGLVFTSPNAPMLVTATAVDHGSSDQFYPVPSPQSGNIPEPGGVTLAICGLLGFGFEVLRRRNRVSAR